MAITLSTDGYAEAADVSALCQQLTISTTSNPTTAEVEAYLSEDFSIINGMLQAAEYTTPVAQAGGSLAVSAGTIVLRNAVGTGDEYLALQGSGGTLSGTVHAGDWFTVGSDAQRYLVKSWADVSDDGEIGLIFAPGLESDQVAGATVTYTAVTGAAKVLKRLNALGAAIVTLRAAYGSGSSNIGDDVAAFEREYTRIFSGVKKGDIVLQGADRISRTRRRGSARLMRT